MGEGVRTHEVYDHSLATRVMKDNEGDTIKHKRVNKDESDIKKLMDHWPRGEQHKKRMHSKEEYDNGNSCQDEHLLAEFT